MDSKTTTVDGASRHTVIDVYRHTGQVRVRDAKKFVESQHPRGQPENKGEFAKGAGGVATGAKVKLPTRALRLLEKWVVPSDDDNDYYSTLTHSEPFAKLLRTLPQYSGTLWRGSAVPQSRLAQLKVGALVTFKGNTSTAKDYDTAYDFTEYTDSYPVPPDIVRVVYRLEGTRGADLTRLYDVPDENEVTLPMGTRFKITKIIAPTKKNAPTIVVLGAV